MTELTSRRTRQAAAALAVQWGYPPHCITELEIRCGHWWSTDYGIGWLMWGAGEGNVYAHGVSVPGTAHAVSERFRLDLTEAARRMGAKRVYHPLASRTLLRDALVKMLAEPDRSPAIRRVLTRAGWKEDEVGPYLEVS